MIRYLQVFLLILLFSNLNAQKAQEVQFHNGLYKPQQNANLSLPLDALYNGRYYLFVQFDKIPKMETIKKTNIELIHYIPNSTYFCAIPRYFTLDQLIALGMNSSWSWENTMKIAPNSQALVLQNANDDIELFVQFVKGISLERLKQVLGKSSIQIIDQIKSHYGLLTVKVPSGQVQHLLDLPIITWVEAVPNDPEAIRYHAVGNERVASLHNPTGENLVGNGVTIGVGDNGKIGTHIDFGNRVTTFSKYGTGTHATHVTGIITGSPNLNPIEGIGTAPGAKIVSSYFSDILDRTPDFIRDYTMLMTNNSYGISGGNCDNAGDYSLLAVFIDEQQEEHDSLIHVFAAGNNGSWTCSPYPSRFATISHGWQAAKSTFTIGAANHINTLAGFSSRGPTDDGRIKPEIVADGDGVRSTRPGNNYGGGGGTSYSSPAMAGITALMYEKYKRVNPNNPDATLIKALLCNAADDQGKSGPDYQWGYGRVNAAKAVEDLDAVQYIAGTVAHGATNDHTITVPANVKTLKVMVMWRDRTAAPFAAPVLVNDLDLIVTDPLSTTYDPWVLDPAPTKVNNTAIRAKDRLNPQEQVTINNPETGNFTLSIEGYRVPFGPQDYYLVYSFDMDGITVRYPNGGEAFTPSNTEYIRWDAFGHGTDQFTIERSLDNGTTWTTLASNISSTRRYYAWNVSGNSTEAMLRVKTATFSDDTDNSFHVIGVPGNFTLTTPCEGYVQLDWDAVAVADNYGIFQYNDSIMSLIDTTSDLMYEMGGLITGQKYWFSVAAMDTFDHPGKRSTAKEIAVSGGLCTWADDIKLDEMVTFDFSRENTLSDLGSDVHLKVALKNVGNSQIDSFDVSYRIDGGAIITEYIRDTIETGDTAQFTFVAIENFPAGHYNIQFWVDFLGDTRHENDTLWTTLRVVENEPVSLPYSDGFESADSFDIQLNFDGLPGLDAWDYSRSSGIGRIRSFAGQNFIQQGNHAITMDANSNGNATNHLILTLNMTAYDTLSDDIRLLFDFMHHEVTAVDNANDRVWVRGSEISPWIEIYHLFDNQGERGVYNLVRSGLTITESLKAGDQNFSSSFQVRFGQQGNATASEIVAEDGYSFDNIELINVSDDLAVEEILHPNVVECGLGMEFPEVRIQNFATTDATLIKVHYRVNGGATIVENIPLIAAKSSLDHTFATAYDFSALGMYEMDIWIEYPLDDFEDNDSIIGYIITHQPIIEDFPYLEGFEGVVEGWYTDGTQSSWQMGNPGSGLISRAAEGDNAWATNLTGDYNHDEYSYLYSPCYDLSGLTTPMLSFAFIYELEDNFDYGWVEYSTDGVDWTKLGAKGDGVNWYNDNKNAWDVIKGNWHVATIEIPVTDPATMFRWALQSDVGLELEGMAIDQVSIYEHDTIYDLDNMDSLKRIITGSDWITIDSNSKRILDIHPHGQDLGEMKFGVYKYDGAQRFDELAYYGDRSFVIRTDTVTTTPIDIKLYITETEAESLRTATECADCISLDDAFQVQIMKYTDAVEDSIQDNNNGGMTVWLTEDEVEVVPFEDGYSVAFSVNNFSELWITGPKLEYVDTLISSIRRASDDAEEHAPSGSVNPFSKTVELIQDIDAQVVGFRFDDLKIPQGSYINHAWIQTRAADTRMQMDTVVIEIESGTNTATFNTGNFDISLKPLISNTTKTWYLPEWAIDNEAGDAQRTPELRRLIEQIIDNPGWKPGNALSLILSGMGQHSVFAFDSVREYAAQLHIVYDTVCHLDHVIYVDASATGFQDGSSWAGAFRTLEEAFALAADCPDTKEIWLKEGTYLPTTTMDRGLSFVIPPGAKIYGGFDGTETMLGQRDFNTHLSILSGDIGVINDSLDNSYHVVFSGVGLDTILLDGIVVRHGTANGTNMGEDSGAGIVNNGKLILRNSKVELCGATLHGTAILISGLEATLIIEDCTIETGASDADGEIYTTTGAKLIFKGDNVVK